MICKGYLLSGLSKNIFSATLFPLNIRKRTTKQALPIMVVSSHYLGSLIRKVDHSNIMLHLPYMVLLIMRYD